MIPDYQVMVNGNINILENRFSFIETLFIRLAMDGSANDENDGI